jgi:hypothetical protein
MTQLINEGLVPLKEVAKWRGWGARRAGRKLHFSTLWRWAETVDATKLIDRNAKLEEEDRQKKTNDRLQDEAKNHAATIKAIRSAEETERLQTQGHALAAEKKQIADAAEQDIKQRRIEADRRKRDLVKNSQEYNQIEQEFEDFQRARRSKAAGEVNAAETRDRRER